MSQPTVIQWFRLLQDVVEILVESLFHLFGPES